MGWSSWSTYKIHWQARPVGSCRKKLGRKILQSKNDIFLHATLNNVKKKLRMRKTGKRWLDKAGRHEALFANAHPLAPRIVAPNGKRGQSRLRRVRARTCNCRYALTPRTQCGLEEGNKPINAKFKHSALKCKSLCSNWGRLMAHPLERLRSRAQYAKETSGNPVTAILPFCAPPRQSVSRFYIYNLLRLLLFTLLAPPKIRRR